MLYSSVQTKTKLLYGWVIGISVRFGDKYQVKNPYAWVKMFKGGKGELHEHPKCVILLMSRWKRRDSGQWSQNLYICPKTLMLVRENPAWDSCLLALEKIPCLLVFENPMLIPQKILIYKYLSFKNTYICWAIPHVFVPNLSCLSHKFFFNI